MTKIKDVKNIKPIEIQKRVWDRKVVMFEPSGKPLKIFDNMMDAAEATTETYNGKKLYSDIFSRKSNIAVCCNLKSKQAYGFQWRFLDETEKEKE